MKKSRVLWVLWLLAVGVYWFFTDGYAGIFLLIVSILLPITLGIMTILAAKKLEFVIRADTVGDKGKPLGCGISVYNKSVYPQDRIVCTISCENLLTGEVYNPTVRMACGSHQKVSEEISITGAHCGRIRLRLKKVTVYDPFGLFRFRTKMDCEALSLLRPQIFGMEAQIAYGESMSLDSDEYSMQKPGFDPSETFAIREYRQGDRPRQIHWKLSEKYDELMVRDYGLPIQNTILLLLETGSLPGTKHPDPDCLDALAQGILSLAQSLSEQQFVYSLGWQNHEESNFYCVEINAQEELMSTLAMILGAAAGEDSVSVLGHYMSQRERCEFAHVVLFTSYPQEDTAMIRDTSLVTEVLCDKEPGGMDHLDGIQRISVSPETMMGDLAYMEL